MASRKDGAALMVGAAVPPDLLESPFRSARLNFYRLFSNRTRAFLITFLVATDDDNDDDSDDLSKPRQLNVFFYFRVSL